MRTLVGICFTLVLTSGLSAQFRGSVTPTVNGSFGSVVFPGGTSATSPGVVRSFGNVVNPGGGGPHLSVPGGVVPSFGRPGTGRPLGLTNHGVTYLYPVFIGGGYGYGYMGYPDAYGADQSGMPLPPQQQPNVTFVMPPQQPATPVIINVGPGGGQVVSSPGQPGAYGPPPPGPVAEEQTPTTEAPHYLIAFKDHSIYSAVAYWVDGDTLHYFTSGNTHNQASLSLLDRELTERLNKEFGVEFKLPAAK